MNIARIVFALPFANPTLSLSYLEFLEGIRKVAQRYVEKWFWVDFVHSAFLKASVLLSQFVALRHVHLLFSQWYPTSENPVRTSCCKFSATHSQPGSQNMQKKTCFCLPDSPTVKCFLENVLSSSTSNVPPFIFYAVELLREKQIGPDIQSCSSDPGYLLSYSSRLWSICQAFETDRDPCSTGRTNNVPMSD